MAVNRPESEGVAKSHAHHRLHAYSNNRSNLATIVLNGKRVAQQTSKETADDG